jgi:hypothetical protein
MFVTTSHPASIRYPQSAKDYVGRFYELVRKWRAETFMMSSATEALEHPAFKEIVSMGAKAISLIIQEIEMQPDLLIAALPILTGEDPVSEADRGDFAAMSIAWIEWYRRK